MSDKALLRRLLLELARANSTMDALVIEDRIVALFDAVREERDQEIDRLKAELSQLRLLRDRVNNVLIPLNPAEWWGKNLGTIVEEFAIKYAAMEQEIAETVECANRKRQ